MKVRTIIVDDEPLARERIRILLRAEPDVEIVAECGSGAEAVEQITRLRPDLLFLDVQMPEMDGFQVLQSLPGDQLPIVIFATAFNQHAVRAFDAHALDYLLKPFKPARFKEAVQCARQQLTQRDTSSATRGLLELLAERNNQLSRLAVKTDDKITFVNVSDVDSIESAGNYVVLHVGKENHILRDTLSNLETRLPAKQFYRVSRSAIVNMERIKELQPMFRGESVIVLKNGRTIPTTRTAREIQDWLTTD